MKTLAAGQHTRLTPPEHRENKKPYALHFLMVVFAKGLLYVLALPFLI